MKFITTFFALASVLLLSNMSEALANRKDEDNLTQKFAESRSRQIKQVDYELYFDFKRGSEDFAGNAILHTELNSLSQPLSIDAKLKSIQLVKLNGEEIKNYKTRNGSIDLPVSKLQLKNKIEIQFIGSFSKEGHGIQRVLDPKDKAEYIYTDFEPYQAHTLFPCFDQPDLKASYKLSVSAPGDWKIIGNELISETEKKSDGLTLTRFQTTSRISSYLFFVGAGPFKLWKDNHNGIPLELYARQSLADDVDVKGIMSVTKKGLDFFSEYFGYKYPFSKYGQVFVPEFAWGGMENPGAVTLNERNIFRGEPKQSDIDDRNDLILHEMAHMWFGDLVTMKWWSDLWLNESFASYLASLAHERAIRAPITWLDFHSTKTWGYWQDQLPTTHPIETEVPDVRTAKANFDGITYAKGAASLKQLHFFVGEEGFRGGLRSYFKKYAFQNTIREDFIREISLASEKDLSFWTKSWLQTAGPHRISFDWSCKVNTSNQQSVIQKFKVIQKPNKSGALSPHKTKIGFYKKTNNEKLELIKTLEVNYKNALTLVEEASGLECPDFIFTNLEDQDYALHSIDKESLKNVSLALSGGLESTLSRLMLWSTLSQMVRDRELQVSAYFQLVKSGLEKESDPALLSILLGRYSSVRTNYINYLTVEQRQALAPQIESLLLQKINSDNTNSELKKVYFDFYASIVESASAQNTLVQILNGEKKIKGLEIDQDRRWRIIAELARTELNGADAIIASEEKLDSSSKGIRSAFAAKVSRPTADAKKSFWQQLEKWQDMPYSTLRLASGRFHSFNRPDLSKPYVDLFFKSARQIQWSKTENDNLVEIYFEKLFPQNICSKEVLKLSTTQLVAASNLNSLARRAWLEANDELEKCILIRAQDQIKNHIEH